MIRLRAVARSWFGNCHASTAVVAFACMLCRAAAAAASSPSVQPQLADLALPFVANAGQTDVTVCYYAQTFSGTVFVTCQGQLVYALPTAQGAPRGSVAPTPTTGWSVTETFVDGAPLPVAGAPAPTHVSSFVGNDPTRWRSNVATYDDVALGQVWAGITVRLKAYGRRVEKVFTVAPGVAPERIRVQLDGAHGLATMADGALMIRGEPVEVHLTRPLAYQEVAGIRRPVEVAYAVTGNEYSFRVGWYDSTLPLTIDPLLQATYLGGSGDDQANALAIYQKTEDVYVAGMTGSTNFPCTGGPMSAPVRCPSATQGAYPMLVLGGGTNTDAFVAQLSSDLKTLKQATYLGGGGGDGANAVAINQNTGDVYVAGIAQVDQPPGFPVTPGGAQNAPGGGSDDAFVALLSTNLTKLIQATYLGGAAHGTMAHSDLGNESASALAVAPDGHVYVAGYTSSSNFPCTKDGCAGVATCGPLCPNGAQSTFGGANVMDGSIDAFVARLDAKLTTVEHATYLGGTLQESASAMAVNPSTGDVYVAGRTNSDNLPCTSNPCTGAKCDVTSCTNGAQSVKNGPRDVFVARLTGDLTMIDQATYLGGSEIDENHADEAGALVINPSTGGVYVAGRTYSTNFPCTSMPCTGAKCDLMSCTNGAQSANTSSAGTAFVAELAADLTTLHQATYLGGSSGYAQVNALALATAGDVFVAGYESSTFPCTSAPCSGARCGSQCTSGAQSARGGGSDEAFVARLSSDLTTLAQGTYLGGGGDDFALALALNATGDVYVAGYTNSADFPGTGGGAQSTFGGSGPDGFVARFSGDLAACPPFCPPTPTPTFTPTSTPTPSATPGCNDGVKNGNETDVDCGGACCCPPGAPPWACDVEGERSCLQSACKRCQAGQSCICGSDCESGVCAFRLVGHGRYGHVVRSCTAAGGPTQPPIYHPTGNPAEAVVIGNLFYVPAKLAFAVVGGVTSGVTYIVTIGNSDAARLVWRASTGGDYLITPRMVMQGEMPRFLGGATGNGTNE